MEIADQGFLHRATSKDNFKRAAMVCHLHDGPLNDRAETQSLRLAMIRLLKLVGHLNFSFSARNRHSTGCRRPGARHLHVLYINADNIPL